MSFFVSDSLKNRVTEENLLEENASYVIEDLDFDYSVVIEVEDKTTYQFELLSFFKKNKKNHIKFIIPDSYKYLFKVLESSKILMIKNNNSVIFKCEINKFTFNLKKSQKRNCYYLKIII